MRIPLALLALLVAAPAAGAGPSSATLEALTSHPAYHILSQRHGVSCDQLPVLDAADLALLTEPALAPAYVPMRAAHCLVERFGAEAEPIVAPWMSDAARSGQALVVVGALDALPADVALRLGKASLAGADGRARERVAQRLKASIHPQVAALGSD